MGGPDGNIRGFRRLGIGSHLGLGPFLRPLPGPWGHDGARWQESSQAAEGWPYSWHLAGSASIDGSGPFKGRGGPEIGDLDTVSYPSRGRDFDLNLVHNFADRLLSAMPNAQQRRKTFVSATMKPDRRVRSGGRSGMGSNIA